MPENQNANPEPQTQIPEKESAPVSTTIQEQSPGSDIGPPRISILTFIFKMIAGIFGGLMGTVILLVIFLLAQTALAPLSSGEVNGDISTIFIFIMMIMVFISSTISNILSTFMLSLTEKKKYVKVSSAIYQVFMVSVIIFLLTIPVYFLTAAVNIDFIAFAIALHLIISAQVSALILQIISNPRHALVGVYGVTFSILISAAILFVLTTFIKSPAILLFAAPPVVWGAIAFTESLVTLIYGWIANIYDKDFLSTEAAYGKDYGVQLEPEPEEEEDNYDGTDEAGADFLRKH